MMTPDRPKRQFKGKCYACGKVGQMARNCREKKPTSDHPALKHMFLVKVEDTKAEDLYEPEPIICCKPGPLPMNIC